MTKNAFKKAYPNWAKGSTYLLTTINMAREEHGNCKPDPDTKSTKRAMQK